MPASTLLTTQAQVFVELALLSDSMFQLLTHPTTPTYHVPQDVLLVLALVQLNVLHASLVHQPLTSGIMNASLPAQLAQHKIHSQVLAVANLDVLLAHHQQIKSFVHHALLQMHSFQAQAVSLTAHSTHSPLELGNINLLILWHNHNQHV
jgi:hypothetical protein